MFSLHLRDNILWTFISSRRFQARVLSTVLCALLIVVRPFSHFGGQAAFLALTIKELVFPAQANLSQQIEATFLHLLGGLTGIALSSFGKFLSSLAFLRFGDTPLTRCIPALSLTCICFLAGWLKSCLPRLTLASRIACFISIWLLTFDVGSRQQTRRHAIEFIWMVAVAAITSLFSCMVLLRWSSTQFATELAGAFSELRACLRSSLEEYTDTNNTFARGTGSGLTELLKRSVSLDTLYQQASFELRIGRVGVKPLKPLITTVEHLRRTLSRPLVIPRPCSEDEPEEASIVEIFHRPALDLAVVLLQCMQVIEQQILVCYDNSSHSTRWGKQENIASIQGQLTRSVSVAREHLQDFCDSLDAPKRMPPCKLQLPKRVLDTCASIVLLLQMAQEIQSTLRLMQEITTCYNESKSRLWHPRFSFAWLGATPTMVSTDEAGTFLDEGVREESTILSDREALQGIAELAYDKDQDDDNIRRLANKKRQIMGRPCFARWLSLLVYLVWNHPRILKNRLRLSRLLKSLERSPHLRHAFKNAAGVALLSLPAFLASDAPGRQWFTSSYGQWMIISYVWVLETNTGATFRVGYLRFCGTILGALFAYIASLFCKSSPYALVAMTALAELPVSWVIMNTTFSPLGTVAAITLPPILFTQYFRSHENVDTWELALLRAGLISVGIGGALLMNSLLFPRHCRVLFLDNVCRALGLANHLFMNMSRDLFHHAHGSAVHKKRSSKLERETREVLQRLVMLLKSMDDEVSLVPKPMQRYRQILKVLHQLSDLLVSLREVGQHIPKRKVIAAVAPQRRELVSCICISLFAAEQVFRARQPLPQFLPSSRMAFIALEREVEEHILQSHQEEHESLGLSLIYVFAELDQLARLVGTIDEAVELTRRLFGTSSWLRIDDPCQSLL